MVEAVKNVSSDQLTDVDFMLVAMLHGMLIKADGSVRVIYPANRKNFTLEELQSFVSGSIERLPLDEYLHMYINDDGIPEPGCREGFPLNATATALLWRYQEGYRKQLAGIHGDVLIVKHGIE